MMTARKRSVTLSSIASQQTRLLVLVEKMEQQNAATIDAVFAEGRRIREELGKRIDDLKARVENLEIAVRKNSEDIRKNSEDIERLRIQVERLNSILETDQAQNVIQRLELRVRRCEERLGIAPP